MLNNKGMTTVEVVISFALVVIIATSLYNTISAYNDKRLIEEDKSRILSYKYQVTKVIQDDFIKIGLVDVKYSKYSGNSNNNIYASAYRNTTVYQIDATLKDGSSRRLVIYQRFTKSEEHANGDNELDDYFSIDYGSPDLTKNGIEQNNNLISYPLPNVGESKSSVNNKTVKDLSINNVIVSLGNDSVTTNTNVLSLYIGFYHPELGTRYAINIVSPVNYVISNSDGTPFYG